jgi:hypothetical protein
MSGLKPGPILEASTTAKANAGILRVAQNDKRKQIPFGNDKQKGKG